MKTRKLTEEMQPMWFYATFLPLLSILDGTITYDAIKYHGNTELNPIFAWMTPNTLLITKTIASIIVGILIYRGINKISKRIPKTEDRKIYITRVVTYAVVSTIYIGINILQGLYIAKY